MLVLASKMEGTLVDKDRRPVPNVRVTRTWDWGWNGKKGSDVSTTDALGHFEFPKVARFDLTAFLPHQPQIDLTITAESSAGPVLLLLLTKQEYTDRSESDGKPFNVVCQIDLTAEYRTGYWGTVIEVR